MKKEERIVMRPGLVTLMCLVYWAFFAFIAFVLLMGMVQGNQFNWEVNMDPSSSFASKAFALISILCLVAWCLGFIPASIALWRMRKWAAYFFLISGLIFVGLEFLNWLSGAITFGSIFKENFVNIMGIFIIGMNWSDFQHRIQASLVGK